MISESGTEKEHEELEPELALLLDLARMQQGEMRNRLLNSAMELAARLDADGFPWAARIYDLESGTRAQQAMALAKAAAEMTAAEARLAVWLELGLIDHAAAQSHFAESWKAFEILDAKFDLSASSRSGREIWWAEDRAYFAATHAVISGSDENGDGLLKAIEFAMWWRGDVLERCSFLTSCVRRLPRSFWSRAAKLVSGKGCEYARSELVVALAPNAEAALVEELASHCQSIMGSLHRSYAEQAVNARRAELQAQAAPPLRVELQKTSIWQRIRHYFSRSQSQLALPVKERLAVPEIQRATRKEFASSLLHNLREPGSHLGLYSPLERFVYGKTLRAIPQRSSSRWSEHREQHTISAIISPEARLNRAQIAEVLRPVLPTIKSQGGPKALEALIETWLWTRDVLMRVSQ